MFTSNQAPGDRDYGDWGGLIILGKAPINQTGGTAAIEGGIDNAEGDGQYGGTDANDNSGVLRYVRIVRSHYMSLKNTYIVCLKPLTTPIFL